MLQDVTTMTTADIESDIEWMQEHFDECERIGQGISTKEGVRMRRLKAELESRSITA